MIVDSKVPLASYERTIAVKDEAEKAFARISLCAM